MITYQVVYRRRTGTFFAEVPDFPEVSALGASLSEARHGVLSLLHSPPAYGRTMRQLEVVKFRGSDFISGMQDVVIRRGGLQVFPRLAAADLRAVPGRGRPRLDVRRLA